MKPERLLHRHIGGIATNMICRQEIAGLAVSQAGKEMDTATRSFPPSPSEKIKPARYEGLQKHLLSCAK